MMTDYQGPRRTRLVVYSCCRSVCILHCISFHWGLRKMGENPIMGQHENRGESRNVSNASNCWALVHALMSVPAIKPDKLAMTLQLCSAIGATGTSQPWTD